MKYNRLLFLLTFLVTACGNSSGFNLPPANRTSHLATMTFVPTSSSSETFTPLPALTYSPTQTLTSTITFTPSITSTASITPTPTFSFPTFQVIMQAHCRYGPAKAFLHAGDLYSGDKGLVWGRYRFSKWLFVKLDKLNYPCWVSPSVVEVTGDINTLVYQEYLLPGPSQLYDPPKKVTATREGDKVVISWSAVYMTVDDDRGYQLDLWVCQEGAYIWWPVSFPDQYTTTYSVTDQAGCSEPSSGKIATVEKHGYSTWVEIVWPSP